MGYQFNNNDSKVTAVKLKLIVVTFFSIVLLAMLYINNKSPTYHDDQIELNEIQNIKVTINKTDFMTQIWKQT